MMTHILLNLPEEYQTIMEILKEELYDNDGPLTIERICSNILVKNDEMKKHSRPRDSREDEKPLYVKSKYKGTCTTCGKYRYKGKVCWYKEGANVSTFYYCDKPVHVKKDCKKRIREEKSRNIKNKYQKKKCNYFKRNNHE